MTMITAEYCLTMAHYNVWQNRQLQEIIDGIDAAELTKDRKAFFGSILGTANHILWGDLAWMARFGAGVMPDAGIPDTTRLTVSREEWKIARFRADADIVLWAETLKTVDLTGMLTWVSGALGCDVSRPRALCVIHMFNHQTHHRGQIHAMLTAAGAKGPVSDLAFMPQDGPWL